MGTVLHTLIIIVVNAYVHSLISLAIFKVWLKFQNTFKTDSLVFSLSLVLWSDEDTSLDLDKK